MARQTTKLATKGEIIERENGRRARLAAPNIATHTHTHTVLQHIYKEWGPEQNNGGSADKHTHADALASTRIALPIAAARVIALTTGAARAMRAEQYNNCLIMKRNKNIAKSYTSSMHRKAAQFFRGRGRIGGGPTEKSDATKRSTCDFWTTSSGPSVHTSEHQFTARARHAARRTATNACVRLAVSEMSTLAYKPLKEKD